MMMSPRCPRLNSYNRLPKEWGNNTKSPRSDTLESLEYKESGLPIKHQLVATLYLGCRPKDVSYTGITSVPNREDRCNG